MEIDKIKEEEIRKTYELGNEDVKEALKSLFPEIVKSKFPCYAKGMSSGALYLFTSEYDCVCIKGNDNVGLGWIGGLTYSHHIPVKDITEVL